VHRTILLLTAASLLACGSPLPGEPSESEEVLQSEQELISDPWQLIFGLRRTSPTTFTVNPIGEMFLTCFDGVSRLECPVERLNFGPSGLNAVRQQELLTRIASEPADEGSLSVLVKAQMVRVRDHTTGESYQELRISAAYRASSVRAHAIKYLYVNTPPVNGYQGVHGLNSDLMSRAIDIEYPARFRWTGPIPVPTSYPADNFYTFSGYRLVEGGGSLSGPYEFDLDQRFRRVIN
jgi:hypothetical protein